MIRIKLSDGTVIEHDVELRIPSKRQIKNKSGRAGRRAYNTQVSIKSVGGIKDETKAIYHGYENGTTNYDELCVVVNNKERTYTDSPGINVRSAGGKATS